MLKTARSSNRPRDTGSREYCLYQYLVVRSMTYHKPRIELGALAHKRISTWYQYPYCPATLHNRYLQPIRTAKLAGDGQEAQHLRGGPLPHPAVPLRFVLLKTVPYPGGPSSPDFCGDPLARWSPINNTLEHAIIQGTVAQ